MATRMPNTYEIPSDAYFAAEDMGARVSEALLVYLLEVTEEEMDAED